MSAPGCTGRGSHYASMSQNNTTTTIVYAGIDVAKSKLDLSVGGTRHSITHDARGHGKLLGILQNTPGAPAHAIIEATGGYEAPLVARLHAASVRLSVIQPARVRYFGRAMNQHAKTDEIDADVLAAFGHAVRPAPAMPVRVELTQLAELITRRSQLVESKVAHTNYAEHYTGKLALAQNRKIHALLEKQIEQCDQAIARHIKADPEMSARNQRLQEVCGIGPVIAAKMIACMPELGTLSAQAAAALAGVAPYNNDSGPRQGTRSIRGGRKEIRCALYMAAMSAVQYDPVLKAFYTRLRAGGKKPIVALTAAMRKLIVLLNHMLKNPTFTLQTKPQCGHPG